MDRIFSQFTSITDDNFLEAKSNAATIAIATRLWQEKEWPDIHIEDSYTMQDFRNEKESFVKKIRNLLEEESK